MHQFQRLPRFVCIFLFVSFCFASRVKSMQFISGCTYFADQNGKNARRHFDCAVCYLYADLVIFTWFRATTSLNGITAHSFINVISMIRFNRNVCCYLQHQLKIIIRCNLRQRIACSNRYLRWRLRLTFTFCLLPHSIIRIAIALQKEILFFSPLSNKDSLWLESCD